jgi:hypothetical protein
LNRKRSKKTKWAQQQAHLTKRITKVLAIEARETRKS